MVVPFVNVTRYDSEPNFLRAQNPNETVQTAQKKKYNWDDTWDELTQAVRVTPTKLAQMDDALAFQFSTKSNDKEKFKCFAVF